MIEIGTSQVSENREIVDRASRAGERIAKRLLSGGADTVRSCPVRVEFMRKSTDPTEWWSPPTMHMLRGGRGGEVRLKLYLSVLWLAVKKPHLVQEPAFSWAVLLGLPDPEGKGKRRIQDAVDWLAENEYLARKPVPGKPPMIELLHDSGTGEKYSSPIAPKPTASPTYRKLEPTFWTNGWMAVLSGAALVIWLAYLDERGASDEAGWLSPSQTRERYSISDDTRKKGLAELKSFGLISPLHGWHREPFAHQFPVVRYRLNPSRLDQKPYDQAVGV